MSRVIVAKHQKSEEALKLLDRLCFEFCGKIYPEYLERGSFCMTIIEFSNTETARAFVKAIGEFVKPD